MRKLFCILFTISLFMNVHSLAFAQNGYEKYGRIATAVVKEDYPGEEVIEFQYAGRKQISETDVVDSFVFEVKENNQLKKVTVNISHSLKNNKLLQLTVDEQKG
ncbi:DUF3889 domain-containing protein [Bacillus sp. FJAT-29937]|uniref:DUF3889 domain-containing protein n=1 Tax=Bacillus sp. FJAT-29937 TaxID=1720553 RepID=UPI000A6A34B9|nr:DUF3889 domain-containing protein [Bacillus sp. FJAT-29937]